MDPAALRCMTVADLLDAHPATAAAFAGRGLACVGCPMAKFETVEEVAAAYAFELAPFLEEVNRLASGREPARRTRSARAGAPRPA